MNLKTYELGKSHFLEGLPVTAMDHAEREHRIAWLAGYLDAALERKIIRYNLSRKNAEQTAIHP